MESPWQKKGKS